MRKMQTEDNARTGLEVGGGGGVGGGRGGRGGGHRAKLLAERRKED